MPRVVRKAASRPEPSPIRNISAKFGPGLASASANAAQKARSAGRSNSALPRLRLEALDQARAVGRREPLLVRQLELRQELGVGPAQALGRGVDQGGLLLGRQDALVHPYLGRRARTHERAADPTAQGTDRGPAGAAQNEADPADD